MKQAAIDFYPSDITIFTQPHDYVNSACDTGLLFKTFCILQTFFTPSRVSDSDTVLLFETFCDHETSPFSHFSMFSGSHLCVLQFISDLSMESQRVWKNHISRDQSNNCD